MNSKIPRSHSALELRKPGAHRSPEQALRRTHNFDSVRLGNGGKTLIHSKGGRELDSKVAELRQAQRSASKALLESKISQSTLLQKGHAAGVNTWSPGSYVSANPRPPGARSGVHRQPPQMHENWGFLVPNAHYRIVISGVKFQLSHRELRQPPGPHFRWMIRGKVGKIRPGEAWTPQHEAELRKVLPHLSGPELLLWQELPPDEALVELRGLARPSVDTETSPVNDVAPSAEPPLQAAKPPQTLFSLAADVKTFLGQHPRDASMQLSAHELDRFGGDPGKLRIETAAGHAIHLGVRKKKDDWVRTFGRALSHAGERDRTRRALEAIVARIEEEGLSDPANGGKGPCATVALKIKTLLHDTKGSGAISWGRVWPILEDFVEAIDDFRSAQGSVDDFVKKAALKLQPGDGEPTHFFSDLQAKALDKDSSDKIRTAKTFEKALGLMLDSYSDRNESLTELARHTTRFIEKAGTAPFNESTALRELIGLPGLVVAGLASATNGLLQAAFEDETRFVENAKDVQTLVASSRKKLEFAHALLSDKAFRAGAPKEQGLNLDTLAGYVEDLHRRLCQGDNLLLALDRLALAAQVAPGEVQARLRALKPLAAAALTRMEYSDGSPPGSPPIQILDESTGEPVHGPAVHSTPLQRPLPPTPSARPATATEESEPAQEMASSEAPIRPEAITTADQDMVSSAGSSIWIEPAANPSPVAPKSSLIEPLIESGLAPVPEKQTEAVPPPESSASKSETELNDPGLKRLNDGWEQTKPVLLHESPATKNVDNKLFSEWGQVTVIFGAPDELERTNLEDLKALKQDVAAQTDAAATVFIKAIEEFEEASTEEMAETNHLKNEAIKAKIRTFEEMRANDARTVHRPAQEKIKAEPSDSWTGLLNAIRRGTTVALNEREASVSKIAEEIMKVEKHAEAFEDAVEEFLPALTLPNGKRGEDYVGDLLQAMKQGFVERVVDGFLEGVRDEDGPGRSKGFMGNVQRWFDSAFDTLEFATLLFSNEAFLEALPRELKDTVRELGKATQELAETAFDEENVAMAVSRFAKMAEDNAEELTPLSMLAVVPPPADMPPPPEFPLPARALAADRLRRAAEAVSYDVEAAANALVNVNEASMLAMIEAERLVSEISKTIRASADIDALYETIRDFKLPGDRPASTDPSRFFELGLQGFMMPVLNEMPEILVQPVEADRLGATLREARQRLHSRFDTLQTAVELFNRPEFLEKVPGSLRAAVEDFGAKLGMLAAMAFQTNQFAMLVYRVAAAAEENPRAFQAQMKKKQQEAQWTEPGLPPPPTDLPPPVPAVPPVPPLALKA